MFGVVDEVQHHLLEMRAVAVHGRQRRLQLDAARNPGGLQRIAARTRDVANDVVDVRRNATLRLTLPRERKQILHDGRGTNRLVVDRLQRCPIFSRPRLAQ